MYEIFGENEMKYPLYDYQAEVVKAYYKERAKGRRSILLQLPTRAGKSLVATKIIEDELGKKNPIWFLGHTKVLIKQMSEELTAHDIKHGIISPETGQVKYRCQVISKDTLFNRYKRMHKNGWKIPKVIIIDETHLAGSGTRYNKLLKDYPDSIIIGLTATPIRLDGKGLDDIYETMVIGPSIKQLQDKERLCPVDTYITEFDSSDISSDGGDFALDDVLAKVDKPKVLKNIVKHWENIAKGKKTLTFCASIAHAQHMADEFNNAGYPSIAVSSEDDQETITRKVNAYYSGKYINLISVQLFIMGFTVKDCECIIQTRPTQSLMIYMQTVGRGMVWLPGKRLINLDCVNNHALHGLPEDDRVWTLKGKKPKKEKEKSSLKRCIKCLQPILKTSKQCEHCGFDFLEIKITSGVSRTPQEKAGKLIKVS